MPPHHHPTCPKPTVSPHRTPLDVLASHHGRQCGLPTWETQRPRLWPHAHPCVRTHVHRPRAGLAEPLELGNTNAMHKHRAYSPWPEHGNDGVVSPHPTDTSRTSAPTSFASPRYMSRARWEEKRSPRAIGRLATPMQSCTHATAMPWPSQPTPATSRGETRPSSFALTPHTSTCRWMSIKPTPCPSSPWLRAYRSFVERLASVRTPRWLMVPTD